MKILIFTELYLAGGVDTFIANLINFWPAEDTFVLVCNRDHPGLTSLRLRLRRPVTVDPHGFPTVEQVAVRLKALGLWRPFGQALMLAGRYIFLLLAACHFYGRLMRHQADRVIVVNGGYPGGVTCRAVALTGLFKPAWGRPLLNFHNDPVQAPWLVRPVEWMIDRLITLSTSHLVTVSAYTMDELRRRPGLSGAKRQVIYNGIEPPVSSATAPSDDVWIEPGVAVILMLATYEERKGHRFLLDAFRSVLKRVPEARLVMAGQGSAAEREQILSAIKERGLGSAVQLLGFRRDVRSLLQRASVLVVPSQRHESFGLTIVEAMSLRVPVVATRVGGIPEVLVDGAGGYLSPLSSKAFADLIVRLLKDTALRHQVGSRGYDEYQARFRPEVMAREYWRLVTEDGH